METAGVFNGLRKTGTCRTKIGNVMRRMACAADLRFIATFTLLLVFATNVASQVPTGSIVGTVKDAQGLPVEGATVTLTNQGTKYTYNSVTSSAGMRSDRHGP